MLSVLGEVTVLGNYKNVSPRNGEQFSPQLVTQTPDLASLKNKLHSLLAHQPITTHQEKMLIAYNLVIKRFAHGDQAKDNMFSNWLLWVIGRGLQPVSYIRSPSVLVEKGHSALCSEQAYLLQTLAEGEGIPTRAVGLFGHVVMEAWHDDDWHLFDPDLEVVPLVANQRVLSLDELARPPELIRKYYADSGSDEYVQNIVDIIGSRENNTFSSGLVLFEWKSNVLFHFKKITNVIKWVFPMILLLTGFGIYLTKSEKNKCAA